MKAVWRAIGTPVVASLIAIVMGGIIAAAIGYSPLQVYGSLISGAFGGAVQTGNTLAGSVPLILAGLGIAVAFRAGLFNIGAEGQYWVATVAAVWIGYHFKGMPGFLHLILILVGAMVVGGLWAGIIPGLLKAYRGAHEVITTMMLSYVGILFAQYCIEPDGPMLEPGYLPQSHAVAQNTWLGPIIYHSQLTWGFAIAIVVAALVWWILFHTTFGFQLRTVGSNPYAARYAGINVPLYTILALGFSGILAGLAGAVQMLSQDHRLTQSFSAGYGYTAIVVALLARNNPFGVILAGIFFSALSTGSQNMQLVSGIPQSLTDVLTGLIIFFVAAERIVPMVIRWFQRRKSNRLQVSLPEGGRTDG
jgi:general nucleoside transport system permease protein